MTKMEGHISDFPKKRSSEEGDEEPKIDSGFAGNISTPQGPMNRMPGVGRKGGEGKNLQKFVDMLKAQQEEDEKQKKNKKKDSPK